VDGPNAFGTKFCFCVGVFRDTGPLATQVEVTWMAPKLFAQFDTHGSNHVGRNRDPAKGEGKNYDNV
jgi:hypothetical protein